MISLSMTGRQEYTIDKRVSLQNWFQENWTSMCKTVLEYFLIPYIAINSKLIKDINIRPENLKFIGETGKTFSDINHEFFFFFFCNLSSKATKRRIRKWDLSKLKKKMPRERIH